MPFGRRSPLETLALPGAMLAYKYSQFRQRRREAASRRVTERELSALHHKIVSMFYPFAYNLTPKTKRFFSLLPVEIMQLICNNGKT